MTLHAIRRTAACLLLAASSGLLAADTPPAFAKKPAASRNGNEVTISFAADKETDVAVFIEDAAGRIVRHLVAGRLGANPPAPLKAGTLEQTVTWDGKADYGKDAGAGPFKVRVALGLNAEYDKVLVEDPLSLGGIRSIAAASDGTVYLVMGCGGTGPVWTGEQTVALNRDGSYLRTIQPFPSNLPKARVAGFDVGEVDGRPVPLVHAVQQRNFYAGLGPRKAGMCVTPQGVVLRLTGASIGALDAEGGAPFGRYASAPLLKEKYFAFGRSFICSSSDGQYAFVSNLQIGKKQLAAVYRVKLPERPGAEPFFGDPETPGNDAKHASNNTRGLATDGKGHLLIADYGNNRVAVVNEKDGAFVKAFDVYQPDALAVDPKSGAVYVLSDVSKGGKGKGDVELLKFSGWQDGKLVSKLPVPRDANPDFPWMLALDAGAEPPVVWLGGDGGKVLRIADNGSAFEKPVDVNTGSLDNASFVDVSVDRWRKEIYARCGMYWWYRFNEEKGSMEKVKPGPYPGAAGSQILAGLDGSLYSPAYSMNLLRFDRSGKPAPWPEGNYPETVPGKEKGSTQKVVKPPENGTYVPVSMTFLTHTIGVRHDGNIFMLEPAHPGDRPPKMLREYLPSGKRVSDTPIIWKVSDSCVGPKFDAQGNIYVAEQVRPVDQPYPPEFKDIVGEVTLDKSYLEGLKDEIPSQYGSIVKFSPKGGMFHFDGENPYQGEPKLDPSLKTVDAASYTGHRHKALKVTGAEWIHFGVSHVDRIACNCENTRFDVDEFGRVFYPDLQRFRVGVIDTNGNAIVHFGGYGNAESKGPDSPVVDPKTGKLRPRKPDDPKDLKSPFAEPAIAFSWLIGVGATDRYAYMGDSLNRRLLRAKLVYAAEETVEVR